MIYPDSPLGNFLFSIWLGSPFRFSIRRTMTRGFTRVSSVFSKTRQVFRVVWNIRRGNIWFCLELSFDLWPRELTIRPLRLKLNLRIVCLTSARISWFFTSKFIVIWYEELRNLSCTSSVPEYKIIKEQSCTFDRCKRNDTFKIQIQILKILTPRHYIALAIYAIPTWELYLVLARFSFSSFFFVFGISSIFLLLANSTSLVLRAILLMAC